ncbi:MAG: 1,4-dihydroxy-6-naphthoate synthase [Bacteroidota bacterium]
MNLTLGFSPCPNDTFIFDAWVNGSLQSTPAVTPVLADVEKLNEWSIDAKLDITKLSYPALFRHLHEYRLLQAGSALGFGVGPLLISNKPIAPNHADLTNKTVLLPGRSTTANLLFTYAYPQIQLKSYRVFSEIEDTLLQGEADLGVIIHENRFTYAQRGLHLVKDLGAHWEEKTGCAIPLGCIAIKRSLGEETAQLATTAIRQSLEHAWNELPAISDYVKDHAQTMEPTVMRQHIDLYVNEHTMHLTPTDLEAIETLYKIYKRIEGIESTETPLFF